MTEQVGILLQNLAQQGDYFDNEEKSLKNRNASANKNENLSRKNDSGSFVSLKMQNKIFS
jgi:hypothetical protein